MTAKIPVTVLTGFLGSGKTTLLNRILREHHGQRMAIIENEFGEIGVDQQLVIHADEEIFEMSNGCICCTVRGDLIRILGALLRRRDRFDRVLLETTGLANPGPVAQTFFLDEEVREHYALDGIITLADARHLPLHLDESEEARAQIAFADVIVINKTDLVDERDVTALERRVRAMNAVARVERAQMACIALDQVLGVGGFDLARALDRNAAFLEPEYPFEWAGLYGCGPGEYLLELMPGSDSAMSIVLLRADRHDAAPIIPLAERALRVFALNAVERAAGQAVLHGEVHQRLLLDRWRSTRFRVSLPKAGRYVLFTEHRPEEFDLRLVGPTLLDRREFAAAHRHDDSVSSVSLAVSKPLRADKFRAWLDRLLRERGADLFRLKGFLNLAGSGDRIVIQGVHTLIEAQAMGEWGSRPRATQLVLIGRRLDRNDLRTRLLECCA